MGRVFLAVAVAAALVCSGCGRDQTATNGSTTPPKVFIEWDATGATNAIPSYKTELIATIQHLAAEHGEVLVAVLDGQPITTASVSVRNFAEAPPETEAPEVPAMEQAAAEGFARGFIATSAKREQVRGSGQLQGLLVASRTPGVNEIMLWSDGVVNEPGGPDLSNASPAEVEAEITRWKPQLVGLKGKTVVVVGGGRDVRQVATVERSQRLFRALVEGNGGRLVWIPTLAQR